MNFQRWYLLAVLASTIQGSPGHSPYEKTSQTENLHFVGPEFPAQILNMLVACRLHTKAFTAADTIFLWELNPISAQQPGGRTDVLPTSLST